MKIELKPGEKVHVTFHESDGEITVAFNEADISVKADLPDTFGREGIIYQESFGPGDDEVDLDVVQTCDACPEQYDVYARTEGLREEVGYFRLRHGTFTAQCPDPGGVVVYRTTEFFGDGSFEMEEQREYHLTQAKAAVRRWVAAQMPHMVKDKA